MLPPMESTRTESFREMIAVVVIIEILIDITVRPHLRLELHPPLVGPGALLCRHLLQLLQLVSLLGFCKNE